MKTLLKRLFALTLFVAICSANAGRPLHDVLKLRTIDVLRFEAVTQNNAAEVSSFVRAPSRASGLRPVASEVAGSVSGFLVEGIVRRQRDLTFPYMAGGDRIKDTQWVDAERSTPLMFFVLSSHPDASEVFAPGKRVNVVLSQRAECDTYPPTGLCVFDRPIRLVDAKTWAKYGE